MLRNLKCLALVVIALGIAAGMHNQTAFAEGEAIAAPQFRLVGIILSGKQPFAILEDTKTNLQDIYEAGAEIAPDTFLSRISASGVTLLLSNQTEWQIGPTGSYRGESVVIPEVSIVRLDPRSSKSVCSCLTVSGDEFELNGVTAEQCNDSTASALSETSEEQVFSCQVQFISVPS